MAEIRDTLGKTLFLGGFNIVAVILLFAFFSSEQSSSEDTLLLATGEWAPYSGEELPQQGVASAIIRAVIQNMGYQSDIRFMPWPQAEAVTQAAENSEGSRATFPYIKVASREKNFYFSLPILDVENSFFFNPEAVDPEIFAPLELPWAVDSAPDYAQLSAEIPPDIIIQLQHYHAELSNELTVAARANLLSDAEQEQQQLEHNQTINSLISARLILQRNHINIIRIDGYEYSGIFAGLVLPVSDAVKTNLEAFKHLMNSSEPLILIEASSVARQLLRDRFPQNYLDIYGDHNDVAKTAQTLQKTTITLNTAVHLMAGKGNPENLRFVSRFNETYLRLKNDGTINKIENAVLKAMDEGQLVRLYPITEDGYIKGYLENHATPLVDSHDYLLLNRGTKAIVLAWSPSFLFSLSESDPSPGLVKIKISQGPHSGRELYIDGRSIELP